MPIGIQGEHVNLALYLGAPTATGAVQLVIKNTDNVARPLAPNERLLIDSLTAVIPTGATADLVDGFGSVPTATTSLNLLVPFSPTAFQFFQAQEGLSCALGDTPYLLISATSTGNFEISGVGRIVAVSQTNPSQQDWQAGHQRNLSAP